MAPVSRVSLLFLFFLLLTSFFELTEALSNKVDCRRVIFHPYCRGISAKRGASYTMMNLNKPENEFVDQSTEPINSSEEQLQQLPWPYAEYHLRGHQTEANSNNQHPSQQPNNAFLPTAATSNNGGQTDPYYYYYYNGNSLSEPVFYHAGNSRTHSQPSLYGQQMQSSPSSNIDSLYSLLQRQNRVLSAGRAFSPQRQSHYHSHHRHRTPRHRHSIPLAPYDLDYFPYKKRMML